MSKQSFSVAPDTSGHTNIYTTDMILSHAFLSTCDHKFNPGLNRVKVSTEESFICIP